jgi:hypothetical protein
MRKIWVDFVLICARETGHRSSVEESKLATDGPEDETTVVEPDQGNGLYHLCGLKMDIIADMLQFSLTSSHSFGLVRI